MKIKAHWQILIAIGLAILSGLAIDPETLWGGRFFATCDFFGALFLQALKMIIVPLIVSSVVVGIASLGEFENFERLGLKTITYYALTSLLSIVLGLFLVNSIQPGLTDGKPNAALVEAIEQEKLRQSSEGIPEKVQLAAARKPSDIVDVFRRMVPSNFLAAAADNGQLLGVIFFSLLIGYSLTRVPKSKGQGLYAFFEGLNEVSILITHGIMRVAPLGVFGLITETVASTGGEIFATMTKYFFTVLLALAAHFLIVLPILLRVLGGVSPWRHFKAMETALLTAFSTASSSATLPLTMRAVRENAGVSNQVSSFVLPLGATVNMDGTALYECIAVLFLAQVLGIEMSVGTQFAVVALALLTSIGVAGIPSASLVAILLILTNVGFSNVEAQAAMAVLLVVDRPLDMCRTAVNIFSDSCGAVIIARSEGESNVLAPHG